MDSQVMGTSDNEDINFLTVSQSFKERSDFGNGVNLLPEEVLTKIFDYVEPSELLKLSEVCHKWNVIIKQPYLWRKKYQRKYKEQPKRYQWFVLYSMVTTDFYNIQPVNRGDSDNKYTNWTGTTPVDNTSCFISPVQGYHVTNMRDGNHLNLRTISRCSSRSKIYINEPGIVNFGNNRLVTSIVKAFKPITYIVEWCCCSIVTHTCNLHKMAEMIDNGRLSEYCINQAIESAITKNLTSNCEKLPIVITDYVLLDNISFLHIISINQPRNENLGDDLINGIAGSPKIFASSLPLIQ